MTKERLAKLQQEWEQYKRLFLAGKAPATWNKANILLKELNK